MILGTKEFISKPTFSSFHGLPVLDPDRGTGESRKTLDARLKTPAYDLRGQASGMIYKDVVCAVTNNRISKSIVIAVCLILSIIIASVSLAQSGQQITSSEEPDTKVAPIRIDDMVLFYVRGIKAFPAGDRAEAIEERIKKLAADRAIEIDSITSVESKMSTDLVADGRPIMSIFDVDASLEGVPRQILAKAYITKLRTSIEKYRKDRITESLIKNALFALLSTVVFIAAIKFLLWLLRKLNAVIESRYKAKIHALHLQSLEFIHAERIWTTLTGAVKVIRLVLTFVLLYFYLHVVLSLFPWTRLLAPTPPGFSLRPLPVM